MNQPIQANLEETSFVAEGRVCPTITTSVWHGGGRSALMSDERAVKNLVEMWHSIIRRSVP
jgi:hypothetical protein